MKKFKKIILSFLLILIILFAINYFLNSFNQSKRLNLEKEQQEFYNSQELEEEIESIIQKGIDFLYDSQLEYGEFKSYYCFDSNLSNCYFDSSPFITTFVLYSIKDISNPKVNEIREKAIDFLLKEQKNGSWSYWTTSNNKTLVSDLDDTSCVSFILRQNNITFKENIYLIKNNKNTEGLYYTWINPPFENDLDCVVNTNVLLYLQENDSVVCKYLNDAIKNNKECSIYYPSRLSFYYMVSRAYSNNITCLSKSKQKIIKEIIHSQKEDGSVGNILETSLALNTLINFDYKGKGIDKIINYLILNFDDAINSKNLFYSYEINSAYFYSEDLTLSIYLEGLNNYYSSYLN
ncbi:MAG: hypothetical protein WC260_02680 [Candidatus Pacearchaeota archaeon]